MPPDLFLADESLDASIDECQRSFMVPREKMNMNTFQSLQPPKAMKR